jgi:chaperonin GroEL (HSP60 family)
LIRWLTAEGVTCSRAAAAGVITTEESDTLGLTVDVVDGIEFDHGYASAYMVANPERMEAVLDNPLILLTNKKITAVHVIGRGRGIRPGSSFASGSASLG